MHSLSDKFRIIKWQNILIVKIIKRIIRIFFKIIHLICFNCPYGFYKENKKRIRSYRNLHKGKRCFIIANGPSLKEIDFNLLKGEITIGMNRIYLMQKQSGFMPNYLVCVAGKSQIVQFHKELDSLDIPCFFNITHISYFSKKKNQCFIKKKFSLNFTQDMSKSVGRGKSVTYTCIQLAFYLGFETVYLIGKDHNYNTNARAGTVLVSDGKEENHFIKGYYKPGMVWDAPDYKTEELAYIIARREYEKNGRKIYDATINGKLNVFEKVDFNSLFNAQMTKKG